MSLKQRHRRHNVQQVWVKHAPFLYDVAFSTYLEWCGARDIVVRKSFACWRQAVPDSGVAARVKPRRYAPRRMGAASGRDRDAHIRRFEESTDARVGRIA